MTSQPTPEERAALEREIAFLKQPWDNSEEGVSVEELQEYHPGVYEEEMERRAERIRLLEWLLDV